MLNAILSWVRDLIRRITRHRRRMPDKIVFEPRSDELACFHEAGHCAAALSQNLIPARIELIEVPSLHARTRMQPTGPARPFIACGGIAVELLLFRSGRAVDGRGVRVSEVEFWKLAMANADADMANFFGRRPPSPWPTHMKGRFVSFAQDNVVPLIDMEIVEVIASALIARRVLDWDEIHSLVKGLLPANFAPIPLPPDLEIPPRGQ